MRDEGSFVLGSRKFQELTKRGRSEELAREMAHAAMDPETGLLKDEYAEARDCPLCGAAPDSSRVMFVKFGFHYRRCTGCGVTYVSPMLRQDALIKSYEHSEFNDNWMRTLMGEVEQSFSRPKFELGMRQIEEAVGCKGTLLELGSAVGQFLGIAADAGWRVKGIEFNAVGRDHCRGKGLDVIADPLTDETFAAASFDAIALWEVLEHVIDPRSIIRACNTVVKPGGVILVVVPNVDSLAAQIMQERCNMFRGTAHLTMFNNTTLSTLLGEEGFEPFHASTIISEISVMNNYLHYDDPYMGEAPDMHPIFDVLNESVIHDNLLGYKLKVVARKKS